MRERTSINIILWSIIAVAISVQLLVFLAYIFSFIPLQESPLLQTFFARHQALVKPEREAFFYHIFLLTAVALQGAGLWFLRRRLAEAKLTTALGPFAIVECLWTIFIVFAVFKIFVYGNPPWARGLLYLGLGAAVLSKVFWAELSQGFKQWVNIPISTRLADIIVPAFIAIVLFIPDITGLLAKMFVTDHFHHFDTMLTSPAWAYLKGGVLDVDHFSHYAVGMPVVLARLSTLVGGLSYESLVLILMLGTIAYYIAGYFFMRAWVGSVAVATCVILFTIKLQMFHPGVAPIIFNYPSATVMRYPLDILLFFLMLGYLRNPQPKFLWGAALVCGFSAFYMIDTGVYMAMAFGAFLCWVFLRRGMERLPMLLVGRYALLTVITGLLFLFMAEGKYLFSAVFWHNLTERTSLFLMGQGNLPMYKSLVEGKYLESAIGFLIPLMYILVLIVTVALIWFKKLSEEHILVAVLCIYGLGLYHYYVLRSAGTSYDVVVWPAVFIGGFFLHALAPKPPQQRRIVMASVFALAAFALLTNHFFLNYPNFLQMSRNPFTRPLVVMKLDDGRSFFNHNDVVWAPALKMSVNSLGETDEGLKTENDFASDAEFKSYYKKEFDFSIDAQMIARLTPPDEKVPLISSFETKILMQANRRPFFYYFPLVDSRPMRMRMLDMTAIWTQGRLQKTLDELRTRLPQYIFMEKILLATSVPAQYQFLYPDLLVILNYIQMNYTTAEEGHWLVAMKRKI